MMDYRIESAEAVDDHRLAIVWTDGVRGIVDFEPRIAGEEAFRPLRDPGVFRDVRIYEFGHAIYWLAADGREIDLCPDILRASVDPVVADWIAAEERAWAQRPAAE